MLSPNMSKTFLSILAVPNKNDFCAIPTFSLIPGVSIHPLNPLLMHPRAPTTTGITNGTTIGTTIVIVIIIVIIITIIVLQTLARIRVLEG